MIASVPGSGMADTTVTDQLSRPLSVEVGALQQVPFSDAKPNSMELGRRKADDIRRQDIKANRISAMLVR
jgi:hypothetical protein